MGDILISVIIPVYNSENTILKCLRSVVSQTYSIHQIIVIDDGSSDNSLELIREFKLVNNLQKLILISQKNSGPSAARNKGILLATGTHIAFLDSDDWWVENKIHCQISYFKNDKNLAICGTANGTFEIDYPNTEPTFKIISFKMLLYKNFFSTSSVVVKKDLLISYNFDVNKKYSEDYDLWLKLILNNKAGIISDKMTISGKPNNFKSGLSSKLWQMEKSELNNFHCLRKKNIISSRLWLLISIYSLLKFIRRFIKQKTLL